MTDDIRRERLRRDDRRPRVSAPRPAGSPAFVGQLAAGGAAPAVGEFMTVSPLTVTGAETPGGAGTFAPGGADTPVLLVGPDAPGDGDNFLCRSVNFRWVASFTAPCEILVIPLDAYGRPVVGATVTIFWYKPTKGAFLDPAANDHSSADYTTTSSGATVPVDSANGVYMVRVAKAGLATTYGFVYACGGVCNQGNKLGVLSGGHAVVPTGATLTTNGGTSPLYVNTYPQSSGLIGTSFANLADVDRMQFVTVGHPGGPATYNCTGTVRGSAGWVGIGCTADSRAVRVYAWAFLMVCPYPTGPTTATNYADFAVGRGEIGSTVTGIESSPFKVSGAWDSLYNYLDPQFGTVAANQPAGSLRPVSGGFTIQ